MFVTALSPAPTAGAAIENLKKTAGETPFHLVDGIRVPASLLIGIVIFASLFPFALNTATTIALLHPCTFLPDRLAEQQETAAHKVEQYVSIPG